MKKNIITVITLAVIAIILVAANEAFNNYKIYNAQCEMYNKLCVSRVYQIDSLVRTFPQDHITLIMGEDGKVSKVKVPNDIKGLETMINETIEINNHCDDMLNNIKNLDKLTIVTDEFKEYIELGGKIDYKIVYSNNSKNGVKTTELNNFLNNKPKLIEYVFAYLNASITNDDSKYKTICKVLKQKFITDDNINIQYNYNEDTNIITFEVKKS